MFKELMTQASDLGYTIRVENSRSFGEIYFVCPTDSLSWEYSTMCLKALRRWLNRRGLEALDKHE